MLDKIKCPKCGSGVQKIGVVKPGRFRMLCMSVKCKRRWTVTFTKKGEVK